MTYQFSKTVYHMKRIFKNIILALAAIIVCTSCEDYFDTIPADNISLDMVFSDRNLTAQWLSNVYSYLPDETEQNYTGDDNKTNGVWTPGSIEGKLPWDHCNSNLINSGTLYSSSGYVQSMWKAYYRGIQAANIYMANVDRCPDMKVPEKIRSKDEARALRAIFYFNLFKIYGPFVIVGDEIFDPEIPNNSISFTRSSVDECVKYIVDEFDTLLAAGHLFSFFWQGSGGVNEFNPNSKGNITKETVEAIRSQVLLYAASYLFNGDPFYKNLQDHTGKYLFPQNRDPLKWEKARNAAKHFMDNNPDFRLVYRGKTYDARVESPASPNYQAFNSVSEAAIGREMNEEMIFFSTRNGNNLYYYMTPKHAGIQGASSGGGALSVPLQMVDLYFTNKGIRIEDDPAYFNYTNADEELFTSTNMYGRPAPQIYTDPVDGYIYFTVGTGYPIMKQFFNREPRFYAAFTFQNRLWDISGAACYSDFSLNGNSGRAKNGHDYPKSGVLARKKLSKNGQGQFNIFIRLSEIYLNYAEASNECGDIGEAIKYVNKIRSRAGIPEYKGYGDDATPLDIRGMQRIEIPLDYEHVTNVIRRERLIELAYENHHYFDVRRWGVAGMPQGDGWVYPSWHAGGEGGNMKGFDVEINMPPGSTLPGSLQFYKRVDWETRIYTERMKLFPIPQNEININPAIVQNTGWGIK